ncbi:MAG: hypothetical protein NZT61_06200 [Deltaproteobacteria bacterium]|nr:hypothetical protein [Deltaproteobacteria bacterium]
MFESRHRSIDVKNTTGPSPLDYISDLLASFQTALNGFAMEERKLILIYLWNEVRNNIETCQSFDCSEEARLIHDAAQIISGWLNACSIENWAKNFPRCLSSFLSKMDTGLAIFARDILKKELHILVPYLEKISQSTGMLCSPMFKIDEYSKHRDRILFPEAPDRRD